MPGPVRIALAADKESADLHTDGPLLIAAFQRLGIAAEAVPWGDGQDWAAFDAVLIRHTWDYVFDRDGFLSWAAQVATTTRLANPLDVLRWNTDKLYLRDLEAAGIPVVPTVWVEPGDEVPVVEWGSFVVKPSVSAGARLSARYTRGQDVRAHVDRIHATGATAMVQPYLDSLHDQGETGTYVFGGEVSHAIRKGPVLDQQEQPTEDMSAASHQLVGPAAVDPVHTAFASSVLEAAPPCLYARVDTAFDDNGRPVLMELEVTEPFLFLEHAPEGAGRFAEAVARWLGADS